MNKKQMEYSLAISLLGQKMNITPRDALEAFGHTAGLMVAHEVSRLGRNQAEAQAECMDVFSSGVVKGMEAGLEE